MNPAILAAALRLGPPLVEAILSTWTAIMVQLAEGTQLPPASVFALAREIVQSVRDQWSELTEEQQRVTALVEIDAEIRRRGGSPRPEHVLAVYVLALQGVE